MVPWKKLQYYKKKYGTIPRTMKLRFTREINIEDYQKTKKLSYIMEKPKVTYQKN